MDFDTSLEKETNDDKLILHYSPKPGATDKEEGGTSLSTKNPNFVCYPIREITGYQQQ